MFGLWSQFFLNCFFSFRPIMPLSTIIDTMSLIIIILVATVFENVSLMIVSSLFYISHMIYRNLLILIFLYLCRDFFHFNGFSHFIDSCLFRYIRLLQSWFRESGFIYNSSFVYIRILITIPFKKVHKLMICIRWFIYCHLLWSFFKNNHPAGVYEMTTYKILLPLIYQVTD